VTRMHPAVTDRRHDQNAMSVHRNHLQPIGREPVDASHSFSGRSDT